MVSKVLCGSSATSPALAIAAANFKGTVEYVFVVDNVLELRLCTSSCVQVQGRRRGSHPRVLGGVEIFSNDNDKELYIFLRKT